VIHRDYCYECGRRESWLEAFRWWRYRMRLERSPKALDATEITTLEVAPGQFAAMLQRLVISKNDLSNVSRKIAWLEDDFVPRLTHVAIHHDLWGDWAWQG